MEQLHKKLEYRYHMTSSPPFQTQLPWISVPSIVKKLDGTHFLVLLLFTIELTQAASAVVLSLQTGNTSVLLSGKVVSQ